ncbi:MAG: hypothetical protein PHF83_05375 [Candidatus Methanomethylophilus sp.]|nr:hypothetical protein [Methanomethylophilus sp.]
MPAFDCDISLSSSAEAGWVLFRLGLYQAADALHLLLPDIFVLRIGFPDLIDVQ